MSSNRPRDQLSSAYADIPNPPVRPAGSSPLPPPSPTAASSRTNRHWRYPSMSKAPSTADRSCVSSPQRDVTSSAAIAWKAEIAEASRPSHARSPGRAHVAPSPELGKVPVDGGQVPRAKSPRADRRCLRPGRDPGSEPPWCEHRYVQSGVSSHSPRRLSASGRSSPGPQRLSIARSALSWVLVHGPGRRQASSPGSAARPGIR